MTYPTLRAQVAFDTDPLEAPSWTTIHEGTATQRAVAATVRTGRPFELDPFQPGRLTLKLDNSDRTFDPLHAAGPYFGKLLPRKRTRLQADWGAYLDLPGTGGAYTGDNAVLDITGDIDLRCRVAPADWTPAAPSVLVAKADITGNYSYVLALTSTGALQIAWTTTGLFAGILSAISTATVGAADGSTRWVRATLDVNDGGGNRVVKFYTSTDDTHDHTAVTWTQLGATVTTVGTTSIFSGAAVATVGATADGLATLTGQVYAAAILSGIGGTVVAAPDFTDGNRFTAGAASGVDSAGRTWTVSAPAVLEAVTYDLFSGFVDTWPQSFAQFMGNSDMTATDGFKILSRIDMSAAYEETVRADSPVAWWRLGDDPATSSICSDSSGNGHDGEYRGSPASVDSIVAGSSGGAVDFDGVRGRVVLDPTAWPSTGPLTVEAWISTATVPSSTGAVITGIFNDFEIAGALLYIENGSGRPYFSVVPSSGGTKLASDATAVTDGAVHHLVGTWDSADNKVRIYVDGVLGSTVSAAAPSMTFTTGMALPRIASPPWLGGTYERFDGIIDEVALYDTALTAAQVAAHYAAGATPWAGDTTGDRISRVLDLAGWPTADRDIDTGRSTMGSYLDPESNALAIAQQAEATEGGAMWQAPDGKVTFRDRHAIIQDWNSTTSQATFTDDGTVDDPHHYTALDLAYDDTLIVNEAAVSWADGVETSRDQQSVDAYTRAAIRVETALRTAPEARDRGDWLLARYKHPTVRPERVVLRPAGDKRLWRHVLARRIGDRVTVRRKPQNTGDPIEFDATIESINHRIADGINTWETEFGLSPTAVDLGWLILDDPTDGLLDTGRLAF